MKRLTITWIIMSLLSGVLAYGITMGIKARTWRLFSTRGPVLDCPVKLDLGVREKGETVVAPFTITNRGDTELLIDEIVSNCGCTGIEQERNGSFVALKILRVQPGEDAHLVMRVTVGGVPLGATMNNFVEFRTNDPDQALSRIDVQITRVSGGVFTSPESVVFGSVPIGGSARQIVEIMDPFTPRRAVKRVTCTGSDQIAVNLLPLTVQTEVAASETSRGTVVGKFEVILKAQSPGDVRATIAIEVEGREGKPDTVSVVGRADPLFELTPSSIVLPLASGAGPVYTTRCFCRSASGKTVELTIESQPAGIAVRLLPESADGERGLEIAWDPNRDDRALRGRRQVIRLRAKDVSSDLILELPIVLQN